MKCNFASIDRLVASYSLVEYL